jgi:hypothetical protein
MRRAGAHTKVSRLEFASMQDLARPFKRRFPDKLIEDAMSFANLDLNLLRVFDVVMMELNLTRAADQFATTQPAVSNALKRLRYVLDDELFIRTAHGVKPISRAVSLRACCAPGTGNAGSCHRFGK